MPPEPAVQPESVTVPSDRKEHPDLRLLHYNDVYHIEPGSAEPAGGVARFQTVVDEYRSHPRYQGLPSLLTFFSGDAFNPSLESSVTKGKHMVPFLNTIGTNVACVGNHDLDFGIAQFRHLRGQCKFPWLLANVLDPALGEGVSLANCEKATVLTASNGLKIGVIGLAEREWLATVNALPPDLIYKSASATAEELVPGLRKQGCEIIIAVTHMREPNDIKLAEKTSPGLIDIVLGGHDHYYSCQKINSTYVLRSGTDFKQLSYIEAWKSQAKPGSWDFSITRRDIVHLVPEDSKVLELVDKLTSNLRAKLEKPIGYTAAPLDGRFTTVRTRESNLGNFVCDLMRYHYSTECAIMAAGTIRGDQIYAPGILQLKDIMKCFPFEDPVVVLKVTGQNLFKALENAVSLVPALEGRYPQVSNIIFEYDASKPGGSRVNWVKVGGEDLDLTRVYKLATRGYMARGKDGFESLLAKSEGGDAEEVVSEENGVLISTILRQYFLSIKVMGRWRRWSPSLNRHWGGVQQRLEKKGIHREPRSSLSPKQTNITNIPTLPTDRPPKHSRTGSLKAQPAIRSRPAAENTSPNPQISLQPSSPPPSPPADSDSDSDTDASDADQIPPPLPLSSHPLLSPSQPHTAFQPPIPTPISPFPTKYPTSSNSNSSLASLFASADLGDRLYDLARRYAKKWMRLAKVERRAVGMVEEVEEKELPVWTRGIAPRLEGRIRIVGQNGAVLGGGN